MSNEEELVKDSPVALLGVGDKLKAARVARGLSLEDVSQALKIPVRVLDQVEANAWSELPGHTFARGIVRGYAKFLHLDSEVLLLELQGAALPKLPVLELPRSTRTALPVSGQSQGRDRLAMLAGVLMVAGSIMAYFLVPDGWLSEKTATAVTPVVREAVPSGVPGGDAPSSIPTPAVVTGGPQAGVPPVQTPSVGSDTGGGTTTSMPLTATSTFPSLVLRFDEMSWVEVKSKTGEMLLSENVSAGSERTVSSEPPIGLALGNAEGVRVTFRGQPVDLKPHTRQKVARLSLE